MESIGALYTSVNSVSEPTLAPDVTAARLVTTVTTSSDPAHELWMLWDAFFTTVAISSTSHLPLLALCLAIKAQLPTQPNNVPAASDAEQKLRSYTHTDGKLHWATLPRFGAQWRDVHDILEARRDWKHVRTSDAGNGGIASASSCSGDELFLHFCAFSALLLKTTEGRSGVHPIWVFYACRDVLECEGLENYQPNMHGTSLEQVRALDIRIAAMWLRDGARALWETDYGELRRHWATALDEKTKLWRRDDGLTRQRWQLWGQRLRTLSTGKEGLESDTKKVIAEAAQVIDSLLGVDGA